MTFLRDDPTRHELRDGSGKLMWPERRLAGGISGAEEIALIEAREAAPHRSRYLTEPPSPPPVSAAAMARLRQSRGNTSRKYPMARQ